MNRQIIVGNLTKDIELRYSQGEKATAIANFDVAVNRRFKREGEPDADFFHCVAFGKQAEFVEKYFKKGSRIIVCGRMENNNYTNKDGEKVYSYRLITEELEFGGTKGNQENTSDEGDFASIPDGVGEMPFI